MPLTSTQPALQYTIDGEGPPVVFSHALGCHLGMWDEVIAELRDQFTVIRYDTRSHGRSELVTTPFGMADLVSDAVTLLDALGLGAVGWVGLSMGGMIGQGLAIAHRERISALVLASTPSRYSPGVREAWAERAYVARTQGMAALADVLMTRWFSSPFREERPDDVERFRRDLLATNAEGYGACCEAIATLDYYPHLDRIACPTLLIAGGADVASPVAAMEDIAAVLPGSRLEVIPGAGHLSAVEQPHVFARFVHGFLQPV